MLTLFLNSIAGSEVIIILLFILVFFGAKSIPGFSRSLGRGIRQIRDASDEVKDEIRKTTGSMRADMQLKRQIEEVTESVKKPLKDVEEGIKENTDEIRKEYQIDDTSIPSKKSNKPSKPIDQQDVD